MSDLSRLQLPVARIAAEFGVALTQVTPMRGGQDSSAAVWRGFAADGSSVAIKATRQPPSAGLAVTSHLAAFGVPGVIRPLLSRSGAPVVTVENAYVSVQPWISGRSGLDGGLSAAQWRFFGQLLARVHAARLPEQVPRERFDTAVVHRTRRLQRDVQERDPDGNELIDTLLDQWRGASSSIALLVDAVDELATQLRSQPIPTVLCHGDAHIANVLVDSDGRLWLLDWDSVVIAPRERDLMFVTDGVLADSLVTAEQRAWFLEGYGRYDVDITLLAYYRCDWALQDLTDFAERVLHPEDWPDDRRAEALRFFGSLLWPTGIVTLALDSLRHLDE